MTDDKTTGLRSAATRAADDHAARLAEAKQRKIDAGERNARTLGAHRLAEVLGVPVFPTDLELVADQQPYESWWPAFVVTLDGLHFKIDQPASRYTSDDKVPTLSVHTGEANYAHGYETFRNLPELGALLRKAGLA